MSQSVNKFTMKHWCMVALGAALLIICSLYVMLGWQMAFYGAMIMVGIAVVVGSFVAIERFSRWLGEYLLERKINRNSNSSIAPELNGFIKRILSQEKPGRHNAKNYLVNMLFRTVPHKITYRVVNYDASLGYFKGLKDDQERQVKRIMGTCHIQTACRDCFDVQVMVMSSDRFVPQFTLENGMTFVVIHVRTNAQYLDFDNQVTNVSFEGEVPHRPRREPQASNTTPRFNPVHHN